jgi:hypothetical protein
MTDPGDVVWYTRDDTDNQPAMPRGVVVADPDGIAIVRYRFIHVTQDHTGERNKEGDN